MNEIDQIAVKRKELVLNSLFFFFIALIIANRIFLFLEINLNHIDTDQPFMWLGAMDYSQGQFYEPRFYGQDYNTFMEGLFAVPFIWLGLPVYYALPLATHLIFLFPFLFTSFYLFTKKRKEQALLALMILLCATTAYDILNSLPRGFVTGLFFTSFFVVSLLNPKNLKFVFLNFVFATIGFFINPNSVLVSVPFATYIYLHNIKEKKFYWLIVICLALAVLCHLFFNQFYINHPNYVIHALRLELSTGFFVDNICHLDSLFGHISFLVENNSFILLLVLGVLAFVIYAQDKKWFLAYLTLFFIVFISFFTSKANDGSSWPYFSYSRMYLGIPVIISLSISLISFKEKFIFFLALLTIGYSGYKAINFNAKINYHTDSRRWVLLRLQSLKETLHLLEVYKTKCNKKEVHTFLISNNFWLNTFLIYGGHAIDKNFPETQQTNSERRYWVREKNENRIISHFLYLSSNSTLNEVLGNHPNFQMERLDDYGLFFIKNNLLPTGEFINLVKKSE